MRMRTLVLHWQSLYSILLYKFPLLCIWCTVWSMEDGYYAAISGYLEYTGLTQLYLRNSRNLYCCTKKLQKLKAVTREAVLQGTDSRWNRAWSIRVVKRSEADTVFLECTNENKYFIHYIYSHCIDIVAITLKLVIYQPLVWILMYAYNIT